MTPEDVEALFREETDHVEWKESHEAKDVLDAVCAFANDLAGSKREGYVVLGVHARTGKPCGKYPRATSNADEIQQRLVSLISSTKIIPHPVVQLEMLEREDQLVFVLRVQPYAVPPVVKVNGTPYVRVGTVTQRANDAQLRRLEERRPIHHQPFDVRPCEGAGADDLDVPLLSAKYRAARELDGDPETFLPFERWLTQRELGRTVNGTWTPNNAAVLVYGLSPQSFYSGAYIDMVRYAGNDYDAPISVRQTITGPLIEQLKQAWTVLDSLNLDVAGEDRGIQTSLAAMFPAPVLKELIRNMVQHRDYAATRAPSRVAWFDDRIELSNPGAPYGQAALGKFGEHSEYRNPKITQLLLEEGYVERAGRGVRRAEALLHREGHPPLEIETNGFTTVTVRRRRE
ncbi:ATP-binding protein [Nannocystis pusilla]|uniref:ATP-binding protein n=1 Tax=Nannocystis pusilla TaxID=889268 RepID=UPI003BF32C43